MEKIITDCPNCGQKWEKNILTNREIEVALMSCKGYSQKEISKTLFISVKTIKNHVSNIYRKLEINSRLSLLRFLVNEGLMTIDDIIK
jgi:two-component system, NarL family, response regulator DegU